MTGLIVSGNASRCGECCVRSLSSFGQFNNIARFSDDISWVIEYLFPFVPLFPSSHISIPKSLTRRTEKNLTWLASGSCADQRGHVFPVAIVMSVYELTE